MTILTVVIPVFNRADLIGRILESVLANAGDGVVGEGADGGDFDDPPLLPLRDHPETAFEIVVVDDCSRDATREIVARYPVKLLCTPGNSGPSRARNLGVAAGRGEILVFVDSDVEVRPDTLARIYDRMRSHPELGGVAAVSAEECPFDNYLSQYQNLFLRYRYLKMPRRIDTPWASLMAVRRDAYEAVDGFDPAMMTYEDYDIGYRLGSVDAWFYLDVELDFVHHKRFRFRRLFADYLRKVANMFSYHLRMRFGDRRIWEERKPRTWHGNQPHFPPLSVGMPTSAVLNYLFTGPALLLLIPALIIGGPLFWGALALFCLPLAAMSGFWVYLARKRGLWFALRGIPTQIILSLVAELGVLVSLIRALGGRTSSDFLGASK